MGLLEDIFRSPIHNLSRVHCRRYAKLPMHHPELVSGHTFKVESYIGLILDTLEENTNRGEAMQAGHSHDFEEGETGDVLSYIKEMCGLGDILDRIGRELLVKNLPEHSSFIRYWDISREPGWIKDLVDFADRLATICTFIDEVRAGSLCLKHQIKSDLHDLDKKVEAGNRYARIFTPEIKKAIPDILDGKINFEETNRHVGAP